MGAGGASAARVSEGASHLPTADVDSVNDVGDGERAVEATGGPRDCGRGVAPGLDYLGGADDGEVLATTVAPVSPRANRSAACIVWSSVICSR